ncbi:hypothetical protein [Streptomyces lincolnensis]|uniref:hypothetical protein n=1 Tax=Streptomyces lincolnensis TaxID=1915 RepID=UPI0037D4677E
MTGRRSHGCSPGSAAVNFGRKPDIQAKARQDGPVDLSGVGAIAAAAVAALGIPAALAVGRWQMRAAIDAVQATAISDREQWRRSLRREACVQFLTATSEFDRIDSDRLDAEATEQAFTDAEAAIEGAHHRATEAYYILRIEAPDLSDPALRLLHAARQRAIGAVRSARSWQAEGVLRQLESESNPDMPSVRGALTNLMLAGGLPGVTPEEVERRRGQMMAAHFHALGLLNGLGVLTETQIRALMDAKKNPVWASELLKTLREARDAFLAAVHSTLNST